MDASSAAVAVPRPTSKTEQIWIRHAREFTSAKFRKLSYENQVRRFLHLSTATGKSGRLLKAMLCKLLQIVPLAISCSLPSAATASTCVWKITSPNGGSLYLGGSVHALRSTDYPLPPAYNTALDASSHLVFEDDPKSSSAGTKALLRAGTYSKGDTLKNHVDPRTYNYIRRFFSLVNVREDEFATYRP